METLFAKILFAHIIGDFFFQHKLMADNKYQKGLRGFLWCSTHVLVYTLVIALLIGNYTPLFILGVYIPHWLLDRYSLAYQWMRILGRGDLLLNTNPSRASFGAIIYVVLDQTMHIMCLFILINLLY